MRRRTALKALLGSAAGLARPISVDAQDDGPPSGPDAELDAIPRIPGWPLPGRLGYVGAMAFSPDGARLVAVSQPSRVQEDAAIVWDVAAGRPLATLEPKPILPRAVAFAPDGARVAVGTWLGLEFIDSGTATRVEPEASRARVWDAATGRALLDLDHGERLVIAVAYGDDGQTIATIDQDFTLRRWRADDGRLLAMLKGGGLVMGQMAEEYQVVTGFSADARRAASIMPAAPREGSLPEDALGLLTLWDAAAGRFRTRIVRESEVDGCWSLALSPDGATIVTADRRHVLTTWDFQAGAIAGRLRAEEAWGPDFLAISPDGRLVVSGNKEGLVRVWDLPARRLVQEARGPKDYVRAAAFLGDRLRLASGGLSFPKGPEKRREPVQVWEVELKPRP